MQKNHSSFYFLEGYIDIPFGYPALAPCPRVFFSGWRGLYSVGGEKML